MTTITLNTWVARHNQRKELASLNYSQLQDIGVTVAQRDAEIRKGFWQA